MINLFDYFDFDLFDFDHIYSDWFDLDHSEFTHLMTLSFYFNLFISTIFCEHDEKKYLLIMIKKKCSSKIYFDHV